MKKILSVLVLSLLFLPSYNFFIHAQEDPSSTTTEQIDSMNVKAQINSDASVLVNEEINYDFGDQEKHGIFRIIPLGFVGKGEPGHITISVTGVTDESGNNYPYQITSKNPINIKVGDPDNTITGKHTYNISYVLKKSIGYFDNYDEWYWNLTGNNWEIPIENVSAVVILPADINKNDIKLKEYCGTNGEKKSCGVLSVIDGKNIAYNINAGTILNPGEGVTIAVGFPKNIVKSPTKLDFVLNWIMQYWFFPIPFGLIFLAFRKRITYFFHRRAFYKKNTMMAEYDAGEFSPMETAGIIYGTIEGKDLSATIINLAIGGYLIIEKVDDESLFKKTDKDIAGLGVNEKKILEGIDGKKESDLNESFYPTANEVIVNELESLNARKYLDKSFLGGKANGRGIWIILPLFLALNPGAFVWVLLGYSWGFIFSMFCILVAVVNIIFRPRPNRLTDKGFEAERKLLGLKEYIAMAEEDRIKFHDAPEKNPATFEKLLPYAMVFGLEKEWAKKFENIYTTPPSWYHDSHMTAFSVMAFSTGMHDFSKSTGGAMTSMPQSSSISGGSSGGGSSGGGGGGGGGGSW